MTTSQGAATARERLRRISSSVEPSVITLHSVSQDVPLDFHRTRRSTDTDQGVREPLLSPFAEQERTHTAPPPVAGSDIQWCARVCSTHTTHLTCSSNSWVSCRKCAVATWASLIVNFFLLAAKLWGFAVSASYSVLASAADSVVDIASQAVLALADWQVGKVDPQYPVGKTRLQTVAVIACAVIMSFATLAVIQESGKSLYGGLVTGN